MERPELEPSAYLAHWARQVEQALDRLLPPEEGPSRVLHRAMRYATLGAGKRLRAALVVAACEAVGGPADRALPVAAAVEMLHAYSLVHDDLPAMDDDDWRRGKPSCHRAFGEGIAILVGDALQSLAFEVVARLPQLSGLQPTTALAICQELACAVGSRGMAGGQAEDLLAEGTLPDEETVAAIHACKTGALMAACAVCGGLTGLDEGWEGLHRPEIQALRRYGQALGRAFQAVDDILDEVGDPATTGKGVGRDRRRRKASLPAVIGLAESRERATQWLLQARQALEGLASGAGRQALAGLVELVEQRMG